MRLALLSASVLLASAPALAQTTDPQAASKPPGETPICTDRPGKANAPCTVPQGDFQIESDVINWSRAPADGATTATTLFTNPTLKYGVLDRFDVELNWAPWEQVRTIVDGHSTTRSSVSDVIVRAKWGALDGDVFAVALIPYVKLPAASQGVGNGRVEGGVIAPVAITLPEDFKLTVQSELDALANDDRAGAHFNTANVIELSRSLGRWTLYAEIWNAQAFDPAGTRAQTTADVAASWLMTNTLQFDAGANFGLDRDAPRLQLYCGISHRF